MLCYLVLVCEHSWAQEYFSTPPSAALALHFPRFPDLLYVLLLISSQIPLPEPMQPENSNTKKKRHIQFN